MHPIRLGQIVISTAGRDLGQPYVVVRQFGPSFVALADGRLRTAARPKRKNCKHVQSTPYLVEGIATRLMQGEQVPDAEIQDALQTFGAERGG